MNFSKTRFSNGAAKVRIIFKLPNLFAKIFSFYFCASLSKNSQAFQPPVFQMGVQRYDFFIYLQYPVTKSTKRKTLKNQQHAEFLRVNPLLQFC
jgi:hypothetical protein